MEQKNILFLHHVSCLGGAESYLLSVVQELSDQYRPFFVTQDPGPLSEKMAEMGVEVAYVKMRGWRKSKYFLLNLVSVWQIRSVCKKNRIQLICCNAYRVSPFAVWVSRMLKIPCVSIVHDFAPVKKYAKFSIYESDAIVTVSGVLAACVQKGTSKEIKVIHNGIDADAICEALNPNKDIRKEFNVGDAVLVGMVANFVTWKRHNIFLESMKIVSSDFPTVRFVIVGKALNQKELSEADIQAYARDIGIQDKVIFTGHRKDIYDVINAFDILVHPSSREAFGRVIAEAMVLMKPVVSVVGGGPEEIIEDGVTGYLCAVDDVEAIADRVKKLIKDKDFCNHFGKNGSRRVREKFSLAKTVNQYNHFFEQVLLKERL